MCEEEMSGLGSNLKVVDCWRSPSSERSFAEIPVSSRSFACKARSALHIESELKRSDPKIHIEFLAMAPSIGFILAA